MKKLFEIFGLGVLMVIASHFVGGYVDSYTGEYSFHSIASFMFYSGVLVLIWGEVLFVWKIIQRCIKGFKELKVFINNRDQ